MAYYSRKRSYTGSSYGVRKKSRYNRNRFLRKRRQYGRTRTRYSRRILRRGRRRGNGLNSRLNKRCRVQTFREKITDWVNVQGDEEKLTSFDFNFDQLLGAPQGIVDDIRGVAREYEMFKVISVQQHYWLADTGDGNLDNFQRPYQYKLYDRDSRLSRVSSDIVISSPSSRLTRMKLDKHYRQSLRPKFLQRRMFAFQDTPVREEMLEIYTAGQVDNPWFRCENLLLGSTDKRSLVKGPGSDNQYAFVFKNDNGYPVKIRGYRTYVLAFKGLADRF